MYAEMHPPSRNVLGSSVTTTSSELPVFVQTLEYRRFVEFCEACRRDRYIGLCYGPPGVGKTLSGIHFSRSARILPIDRWSVRTSDGQALHTIFYPKFFSRIGFVHEFRPLPDSDVEMLLRTHWAPTGVQLPKTEISPEVVAAIARFTRGNFRLLTRLLTQMHRVVEINQLSEFSIDVVETARENLVIGQA